MPPNWLGSTLVQLKRADEALKCFMGAYENGNTQFREMAIGSIALCYTELKKWKEALKWYKMDEDGAQKRGIPEEKAEIWLGQALCYQKLGQFDKGEALCLKGIRQYEELQDIFEQSRTWAQLADLYKDKGDTKKMAMAIAKQKALEAKVPTR